MTAGNPQIRGRTGFRRAPVLAIILLAFVAGAYLTSGILQPNGATYMPHGMCFLWSPNLLWSNVVADIIIACSYVAIAVALVHLVLQNSRRLPFNWMFLSFASFILACAGTHILEIVTLWVPVYWLSTDMKYLTAGASAITALAIPVAILRVTATMSRAELADDYRLETLRTKEVLERQTIDRALQLAQANSELERALTERLITYDEVSVHAPPDDVANAAARNDSSDLGIAIVQPPDENDDLARIEALIERARLNTLLKARIVQPAMDPHEVAALEARAELGRRRSQLERRIATCTRENDDVARFEAVVALAELNAEVESRLAEQTLEVERLNATLTKQIRDLTRAYDDLESYASALGEHEEQQRTHAQQLRALHAIASATTAQGDDQIEKALRLGLRSLDLDWAYLGIIDHATDELVIHTTLGEGTESLVAAGERVPMTETIFGAAIVRDPTGVVLVQDVTKLAHPPLHLTGWSSYIAVPLRIGGTLYGVIGFLRRELRAEPFSQANVEFLSVAAELISSAVERRLKNEQLETSESRYRALAEALPQLVWVVDAVGQLDYTNERWSQYTGHRFEDSRTIGIEGFYERADLATIDLRTGPDPATAGFEYEARLRRFDNVYRWHLIRGVPFAGTSGLAGKWIVTGTDIEERKLSESLTSAAHTAALAATESKSRFLATMSHEIRTPMNGIVGMTELLLLTTLNEEQREYAAVVRDSGQSLLRVLNDILDYSKIEAGKVDIETVVFDLPGQLESVIEILGVQFRNKQVVLKARVDTNVPESVLGDPGRVRQILLNLAGNALKFTPAGGAVTLKVTAGAVVDGKTPVRFTVKDTGIGIAPHVAQRLFQPFTQGDASTTRQYGGTGLGLSISAQLVALMSGSIGVESVPGAGSSFWFEIPFVPQAAPQRVSDDSGADQLQNESCVARNEKVLVVDDNEINALLAAKQLKRLGFDITTVSSGRRAIDVLEREHFDLVFMDCQMPEMDGFETTREIRLLENGFAERVTIVAMTADARPEDRQRCLDCGMDDYLSKPTKLSSLKAIVDRWLPAVERRRSLRTEPPAGIRKPTLGLAMLLDLFDGDRVGVRELLDQALRSIRADVGRIERAAFSRDRALLIEAAHRLKGTSGSIRSVRLVEIGASIQTAASSDGCTIAPALLIGLREALRSLDEDIRTFIAEADPVPTDR